MSSSASEASQPLISSISQQATNTYSSTSHPGNPSWSLLPSAPSQPSLHPQHPVPSQPAAPAAPHWSPLSCVPWLSGGGSGAGYEDKELIPTNIVYKNWDRSHYSDFYYWALRFAWLPFVLVVFAVFFAQVLLFALLNRLLLVTALAPPSSPPLWFTDLLLLHLGNSAGYGTGPYIVTGSAQHLLLSIEALARTIYFTLVTGILYARFSKPVPRIRFSRSIFVCRQHGVRSLVLRIANDRLESRQTTRAVQTSSIVEHCQTRNVL